MSRNILFFLTVIPSCSSTSLSLAKSITVVRPSMMQKFSGRLTVSWSSASVLQGGPAKGGSGAGPGTTHALFARRKQGEAARAHFRTSAPNSTPFVPPLLLSTTGPLRLQPAEPALRPPAPFAAARTATTRPAAGAQRLLVEHDEASICILSTPSARVRALWRRAESPKADAGAPGHKPGFENPANFPSPRTSLRTCLDLFPQPAPHPSGRFIPHKNVDG